MDYEDITVLDHNQKVLTTGMTHFWTITKKCCQRGWHTSGPNQENVDDKVAHFWTITKNVDYEDGTLLDH